MRSNKPLLKKDFGALLAQRGVERAFAMDEARFGLKSWYRRRWCPRGLRPPWVVADRYEWLWLYAAVEPRSEKSFFLLLPCLDTQCFTLFLQRFRHTRRPKHVGLVLDNSPSHISGQVKWPKGVTPLRLPPYSPELNPVERFFKELRSQLANKVFENLEALEATLTHTLRTWQGNRQALSHLTYYPWWRDGLKSIPTS
jgi:transposase